jgi:Ca2+/H+ antiporter, TMEM165/GDT1 family
MRRRPRIGKVFMILFFVTAFISLFSFIVMSLWNAILPQVLHVTTITFWQAMGILVLSKILFGGFGGWGHKKHEWKRKIQQKWQGMTPEEREKFEETLKSRFGSRWCPPAKEKTDAYKREPGAE